MSVYQAIVKRELKGYFATPIALIFLTVFLVLNGFFTFKLGRFYELGQADLRAFFVWHPWLYLFIVPAISMRLWAEERRSGTIELLLTLPVSMIEAMLGKFTAAWLFIGLALALTLPIVFTVIYLGEPDLGVIVAGYIGSFLMAGAFLAVGCAVSAATSNQVISFVVATAICLILILLGFDPVIEMLSGALPQVLTEQLVNLSFPYHFEAIQRGVVNLADLVYFVTIITFALLTGVIILDRKKAD
ncbi:MAG: ABC transporter permease [Bdellovibrionales bacterium]|nr:ABC transporter permease [Bdellovibrionales bacterium]